MRTNVAKNYELSINLASLNLFEDHGHHAIFKQLRSDEPVYLQSGHPVHGDFWNLTRYDDIQFADSHPELFSSQGSVVLEDQDENFPLPMFIAMDRPKHTEYRSTFAPAFTSKAISELEPLIRLRTRRVIESLPINTPFDWVEQVSIELTSQMLATLFNFPLDDRKKLIRWSNVATATQENNEIVRDQIQRQAELMECLQTFQQLKEQAKGQPKGLDLLSLFVHSGKEITMLPSLLLGNILLLLVAGNDTTRNSMTGSVAAINEYPDQFALLKRNPELLESFVNETIRWQTPLAYMRRTALTDIEMQNKKIRAGDKVLMWYASGNCDEAFIDNGEKFDITRDKSTLQKHLSFGFGIHRCIGKRLGELQLRILWEELLAHVKEIEAVEKPNWIKSNFVKGYSKLNVIVRV